MNDDAVSQVAAIRPLIEYPTVYTFKVIGRTENAFRDFVLELFRRVMGREISPDSLHEVLSKKGRYVSVNVSVYLLSEEQRRAVYLQLHRERRVLYYL